MIAFKIHFIYQLLKALYQSLQRHQKHPFRAYYFVYQRINQGTCARTRTTHCDRSRLSPHEYGTGTIDTSIARLKRFDLCALGWGLVDLRRHAERG